MARGIGQLTCRETTEFEEILRPKFCGLAETDHNKPFSLEPRRDNEFQRRVFLACKPFDLRGPLHLVEHRSQGLAGSRAEFQSLIAKDDDDALRRGGERAKAKLESVSHRLKVLFFETGRRLGGHMAPPRHGCKDP